MDSCHGPHWHLSLYEYFTAAHTPCRSSKCSRNTQLQIPRITQGYTKWCITILIILHVYCVTACHILALKMSALCVPQINTICIQDIIFALIDIKCQPVRRCSYRGGHLGHKDVWCKHFALINVMWLLPFSEEIMQTLVGYSSKSSELKSCQVFIN